MKLILPIYKFMAGLCCFYIIATFTELHASPNPLPVSDTYTWMGQSNQAYAEYGKSVSGAGDVNGDGYEDIIVGVHYWSNPEFHEGRAVLYYGSASGISPAIAWSFEPNVANATCGISVSRAGDVNGDGYADVIVGAHTLTEDLTAQGKVFVFYGGPSGLSATPSWTAKGDQASCDFGGTVSNAGDVNNDGYDDVIIGAIFYNGGQPNEGRTYVYYGSPTGLTSSPWIAEINQAGATFGSYVSDAGDVNNDGYGDVIIGARKYTNGQSNEGGAFVYLGGPTGLAGSYIWSGESNNANAKYGQSVSTAGDVNHDGYDDIIVGAHNYASPEIDEGKIYVYYGSISGPAILPSFTYESNQADAWFGNQVTNAGDVNHDGYDDVLVGSRTYDNVEANEGRAYVFYGSSTGLSALNLWHTEINQAEAYFGYSVGGAGDVNGDGFDDIIIGSKYYDSGETDEGAAFVFLGQSDVPVCTAPSSFSVSSITSTSAYASWAPVASATSYKITLKKTGGATTTYSTINAFYTFMSLDPASNYKSWVIAKCGALISERSNRATFNTPPLRQRLGNESLRITPNPASESIIMQLLGIEDIINITILDGTGKAIDAIAPNTSPENNYELSVKNYATGFYIVKIQTTHGIITQQFIVQH